MANSKLRLVLLTSILLTAVCLVSGVMAQAATEEIRTDGILIHGERSEPEGLDPHVSYGTTAEMVGLLLYDTLVARDPSDNIVPLLATSWEISPDQLTYTFTIRTDVKFHSGKPLTSADVKYSLDRVRDPQTASAWASMLESVETVEAPSPDTVVLRLSSLV